VKNSVVLLPLLSNACLRPPLKNINVFQRGGGRGEALCDDEGASVYCVIPFVCRQEVTLHES
jgi:hypothetical protein